MIRKVILAVATVGAAGTFMALPASASDATSPAAHITAGGTSAGTVVNGSLTVAFNCTATSTGLVASINITSCKLSTGGPNKAIALPGNTATTAGTANVPLAAYKLCFTAIATYLDSSTRSVSGCTNLVPSVGGLTPGAGVVVN